MGRPITVQRTGSEGDLCDSLRHQRERRAAPAAAELNEVGQRACADRHQLGRNGWIGWKSAKPVCGLLIGYGRAPPTHKISPLASQQRTATIPTFFVWEPGHRHPAVRRGDGGDPGRIALRGESNTRKGDSVAKAAAGGAGADSLVADQLRALGVKGVLVRMAERGQLLALRCEMPQCYHHKGRGAFDPVTTPRTKWAPSPDHYPILKSAAGTSSPRTFDCPTSGATTGTMDGGRRSGRCSRKASPSPRSPRP